MSSTNTLRMRPKSDSHSKQQVCGTDEHVMVNPGSRSIIFVYVQQLRLTAAWNSHAHSLGTSAICRGSARFREKYNIALDVPRSETWHKWRNSSSTLLVEDNSVARAARQHFLDGKGSTLDFVLVLADSLYTVGVVGIKTDSTTACFWPHYSDHRPAAGSIRPSSIVQVHPTFWRALGVRAA